MLNQHYVGDHLPQKEKEPWTLSSNIKYFKIDNIFVKCERFLPKNKYTERYVGKKYRPRLSGQFPPPPNYFGTIIYYRFVEWYTSYKFTLSLNFINTARVVREVTTSIVIFTFELHKSVSGQFNLCFCMWVYENIKPMYMRQSSYTQLFSYANTV